MPTATIRWTAPRRQLDGGDAQEIDVNNYRLERAANPFGPFVAIITVAGNVKRYDDVVAAGIYYYRLFAITTRGETAPSPPMRAAIGAAAKRLMNPPTIQEIQ